MTVPCVGHKIMSIRTGLHDPKNNTSDETYGSYTTQQMSDLRQSLQVDYIPKPRRPKANLKGWTPEEKAERRRLQIVKWRDEHEEQLKETRKKRNEKQRQAEKAKKLEAKRLQECQADQGKT